MKMNLIFTGNFPYPHGMAGTKRVQNSIDQLTRHEDINIKVLILRQGRTRYADGDLCGTFKGVEYITVGDDIEPNIKAFFKSITCFFKAAAYLRKNYNSRQKNIIYIYGYPSTDNISLVIFGKILGYKVLFDIVEDVSFMESAPDIFARIKHLSATCLSRIPRLFTDGVLVISGHLQQKMLKIAKGRFPVFLYPVSVNFAKFESAPREFHDPIRLFYGGTFGSKDGIENLISAFEIVCAKYDNAVLTLTGKGAKKRMEKIQKIISESKYRERFSYKGYLEDDEYYNLLSNSDILCMTRTGSAFAGTGFPFKLGEYLATGRSVIASGVSDVRRYLEDKKNAVIIEPDSVSAITEAIEFLITHPDEAKRIGQAGKETAKKNFDAEALGKNLRQILTDI